MTTSKHLPLWECPGFVALSSTIDPEAEISPEELRAALPHFDEVCPDLLAAMRRNYRARLQQPQPNTEIKALSHARQSA